MSMAPDVGSTITNGRIDELERRIGLRADLDLRLIRIETQLQTQERLLRDLRDRMVPVEREAPHIGAKIKDLYDAVGLLTRQNTIDDERIKRIEERLQATIGFFEDPAGYKG